MPLSDYFATPGKYLKELGNADFSSDKDFVFSESPGVGRCKYPIFGSDPNSFQPGIFKTPFSPGKWFWGGLYKLFNQPKPPPGKPPKPDEKGANLPAYALN